MLGNGKDRVEHAFAVRDSPSRLAPGDVCNDLRGLVDAEP
jgi:hypothetical protein